MTRAGCAWCQPAKPEPESAQAFFVWDQGTGTVMSEPLCVSCFVLYVCGPPD
jgi:hypothetical protein